MDPWTVTLYTVPTPYTCPVSYLLPEEQSTSGITELASSTIRQRMCVWAAKRNKMKWHENEMGLGGLFVVCSALVIVVAAGCVSQSVQLLSCAIMRRVCVDWRPRVERRLANGEET